MGSGELACSVGAGEIVGSGELSSCFKVPFLDFNLLVLFLALRIFLVRLKIFSDIFRLRSMAIARVGDQSPDTLVFGRLYCSKQEGHTSLKATGGRTACTY